jgi:glycosyltransferase involved in cell wall biosynthesis
MSTKRFVMVAGFAESTITFRGQLIRDLIEAGQDVVVVAPGLVANASSTALRAMGARPEQVPMRRAGTSPPGDLAYMLRLWRLMRRERPSRFLGYTIKPVIYGTLAAWLAGVPQRFALITGLGYAFTANRSGALVRLVRFLYRLALAKSHIVIFQNPDDLALFKELRIIREDCRTMVVNGSGIDVLQFQAGPPPVSPVTFLMIARLIGDKGVREYVEAARLVRTQHPEARFQLAGWIDDNPGAISAVELDEWRESGTIEFLGRLDDVRPAIEGCTVYVLPSYREGTPRTVLEAMAMGRAIITTDVPGCRQTTSSGDNGFLVPAQSAPALSDAMLRFIHCPELAVEMGAKSREIAEQRYDIRKVNAAMLQGMGFVVCGHFTEASA